MKSAKWMNYVIIQHIYSPVIQDAGRRDAGTRTGEMARTRALRRSSGHGSRKFELEAAVLSTGNVAGFLDRTLTGRVHVGSSRNLPISDEIPRLPGREQWSLYRIEGV